MFVVVLAEFSGQRWCVGLMCFYLAFGGFFTETIVLFGSFSSTDVGVWCSDFCLPEALQFWLRLMRLGSVSKQDLLLLS